MDQWFSDVARPALFEALNAACSDIDSKLGTALAAGTQAKSADATAELEALRAKAELVDRLQKENILLQQQLLEFKNRPPSRPASPRKIQAKRTRDGSAPPHTPSVRTPLGLKSTNEAIGTHKQSVKRSLPKPPAIDVSQLSMPELRIELSQLQDRYQRLYDKYAVSEDVRAQLEQKLRGKLTTIAEWKTHAERLNTQSLDRLQRIKVLRAKLFALTGDPQLQPSRDQSIGPDGSMRGSASRTAEELRTKRTDGSGDDTNSSDCEPAQALERGHTGNTTHQRQQDETSSATYDKNNSEPTLPPMHVPMMQPVSQDILVKNEPSSDPIVVFEKTLRKRRHPGGDDQSSPQRVKIKSECASDPVSVEDSDKFVAHESMDLDADGQLVKTPKKNRHQNIEASLVGESENKENQPDDGDPEEQDAADCIDTAAVSICDSTNRSTALVPLPPNVPRQRTTSPLDVSGKRFQKRKPAGRGLASLAEDGELYDNERRPSNAARQRTPGGVLYSLLHSNTPDKESIVPPQTSSVATPTPNSRLATPKNYQFPIPEKRQLPFGGISPKIISAQTPVPASKEQTVAKAKTTSHIQKNKSRREGAGHGRPLRGRPVNELKVTDFRINPAANDGFDYAFTDIVRGREERSRLPGDLSVHADEFRAQARAQRHQTGSAAFTALIENWLGDNAHKLAEMSAADKERIWEDAKTEELARTCGRVKHRFQRQRTPPGAWRTDFPSTQEEEAYREEARRKDQDTVNERYREAMRPGGVWMFRDE
ncbi:DNA repair [Microdochium nivale]|nr:DNA repair [Microdochium nivale]